jgi:hypothetical protein
MTGRQGFFFHKLAICFEFLFAKSRISWKKVARFHPELQQVAKNKEGCQIYFFYFYILPIARKPVPARLVHYSSSLNEQRVGPATNDSGSCLATWQCRS